MSTTVSSVSDVTGRAQRRGNGTSDCGGALVRAHCRHLATVVTIRGEIDSVNVDQVSRQVRRFVVADSPAVLDLSGITQFSAAGISLLCALDEECRTAGVEWTVVASPAVADVLGNGPDSDEAVFPITRSVHEALRNLAEAIVWRRQRVLPLIKKTA